MASCSGPDREGPSAHGSGGPLRPARAGLAPGLDTARVGMPEPAPAWVGSEIGTAVGQGRSAAANRAPRSSGQLVDRDDLDCRLARSWTRRGCGPAPAERFGWVRRVLGSPRRSRGTSSASPSQSKDSGTRYGAPSAEALATRVDVVGGPLRCHDDAQRRARVGVHLSWSSPSTVAEGSTAVRLAGARSATRASRSRSSAPAWILTPAKPPGNGGGFALIPPERLPAGRYPPRR